MINITRKKRVNPVTRKGCLAIVNCLKVVAKLGTVQNSGADSST
jgi:hypothetical protein